MLFTGLDLSKLRNAELLQFITDVIDITNINNPLALNVGAQLVALQNIRTEIEALFMTDQGSDTTPLIQAADRRRDDAIIGITNIANGYTYHYDPAKRAAGVSISDNLRMYGGTIANQNYMAETTVIRNFLQDTDTKAEIINAVALLGLADWLTELRQANDDFHAKYLLRSQEIGAANPNTIKEKRLDAGQRYYTLRDTIGAYHTINNGINPWGKAANDINAIIAQYNVLLAGRANEPTPPTPPPPDPQPQQ